MCVQLAECCEFERVEPVVGFLVRCFIARKTMSLAIRKQKPLGRSPVGCRATVCPTHQAMTMTRNSYRLGEATFGWPKATTGQTTTPHFMLLAL